MKKANWRRKLAVLLSVCVLGTSGTVPDPAVISFAASGEGGQTATFSDSMPDPGADSGEIQTPELSEDLATSSNAAGRIVEFEGYEDEESPLEIFSVEEGTPLEELPLPDILRVYIQKREETGEKATSSNASSKATPSEATSSDADTDPDLLLEEDMEVELENDLENGLEADGEAGGKGGQESGSEDSFSGERTLIDLPVGWVQEEGEDPYTGENGQSADFIPTWDYEAYPLAEGYEPNLFVTVQAGVYPSLDLLEIDEDRASSFVFSDEDTDQVEAALDRKIPAAHGSAFGSLLRLFKQTEDYRFDNYYILNENNLGTENTKEVQNLTGNKSETKQLIKYQIDFHSDVRYHEGEVEIQVPYSIYTDRNKNGVRFSDIGIPKAPDISNSSSFSYKIDENHNKIVITNNKVIPAGSNNFFQVFYALDDLMTKDETCWEIKPELFIKGENQDDAGRILTGSMDTEAILTAAEMKAYTENNKCCYPELYTIAQVEGALKTDLPEQYKKNFDQYRFALWITEIRAEASQPWTLTITDTPEEGGQVVGQYLGNCNTLEYAVPYLFTNQDTITWDAVRYGMGTGCGEGLKKAQDRGDAGRPVYLFTVAAYPSGQEKITNHVKVSLKGQDEPEETEAAVFGRSAEHSRKPYLYFDTEVLYLPENDAEIPEFTFVLEIDGQAAKNHPYFKVDPDGDMRQEPEKLNPSENLTTGNDGTFQLKAGERICLVMDIGEQYQISEIGDCYGEETDYICEKPVASGVIKGSEFYSHARISNLYRYAPLQIETQVAAKDNDTLAALEDVVFTYQIQVKNEEGQWIPYAEKPYTLKTNDGEEEKITDKRGQFTMIHGQSATFHKVERGAYYQVEEVLAGGVSIKGSEFRVIEPVGGISEGFLSNYGSRTKFKNQHKLRDLTVKNRVIYPPDLENEVSKEEFSFTLKRNEKAAGKQHYKKYNAQNGEIEGPFETDENGTFTLKQGEFATFGFFWEGDTFEITENPKRGYMQTVPEKGKPAEGTISWQPKSVYFENHFAKSYVGVTQKVVPKEGEILDQEDYDQEFSFTLVVGNEPWGGKEYYLIENVDDTSSKDSFEITDSDGSFKLKHGQGAQFSDMPYGVVCQVTESAVEGYCQILPEDGKDAVGIIGSISKEGMTGYTAEFKNQRNPELSPAKAGSLVIETELKDGAGVPEGFTKRLLEEFNYDDDGTGWDDIQEERTRALLIQMVLQVDEDGDGMGTPYEGKYQVLGPGNRKELKTAAWNPSEKNTVLTCYPGQKIVIPDLKIGSSYKVQEITGIYQSEEEFWGTDGNYTLVNYSMKQMEPENYGILEGKVTGKENPVRFVNGLFGLSSSHHQYVSLESYLDENMKGKPIMEIPWEEKYADEKLTLRLLKRSTDGSWVPAEGIRYQIYSHNDEREAYNDGPILPYPIQTTGRDGEITMTPFSYEYLGDKVVGGMQCLLHLDVDYFLEDYRIEEVEERTTSGFGKLNGAYSHGLGDPVETVVLHRTADRSSSLEIMAMAAPQSSVSPDHRFRFQLSSGIKHGSKDYAVPYLQSEERIEANCSYSLYETTDEGKKLLGTYQTDRNGIFSLEHGQTAVFRDLQTISIVDSSGAALGRLYHIKELADPGCKVTVKNLAGEETSVIPALKENEVVISPKPKSGFTVIFENDYQAKPELTIYNKGRGGASYDWNDVRFTFNLNIDGMPYANKEYRLYQTVFSGDEGEEPYITGTTNEYGEFSMKAGQYARFEEMGVGARYEISAEIESENVDVFPVNPAPGTSITGVIGSTGNEETFISQYNANRYMGSVIVRNTLSFPYSLTLPEDSFQFRLTLDGMAAAAKEFRRYDAETEIYLDTGITDGDGKFTLKPGQFAVFDKVGWDGRAYKVQEMLPPSDSIYQILSPTDGVIEGLTYSEGFAFAHFINGIPAIMVTKEVINAPGMTAPEDEEFIFEIKTGGNLLQGGRYWLYDSHGGTVDSLEHRTDDKGRFKLKAGQKALFVGIGQGMEYEVRELPKQFYTQTVPTEGEGYVGTVTGQVNALVFENRYSREAAMSVSKEVRDSFGQPIPDDTTAFTFQLHINGNLAAGRTYTLNDSNKEYQTDGNGQFKLRHGDTAHFGGLRDGSLCVVKEVDIPEGYQAKTQSSTARLKAGESLGVDEVTGEVSASITEETQITFINRKAPTIWVENTTGDDTGNDASDDNLGGTVAVLDGDDSSVIPDSEHEVSSGGTDDNTKGRYQKTAAAAKPEAGWEVSLKDTVFGPMGAGGRSGAVYRIGDLPEKRGEEDPDMGDFYNPVTGGFRKTVELEIAGESRPFVMEGILKAREASYGAKIIMTKLPCNLDIGFRFRKRQYELPSSGGPGTLPFILSGLTLMCLSAWELKRRRRKGGSR